jgi:glycosyltransferase involved in cell wall biosynthesis
VSETPFLSVIVPTRNRNRQLGECLGSLAEQDYPRPLWEVIVVFDGEDFQPDPELSAIAGRMPLTVVTQPHAGCGIARNTGAVALAGVFWSSPTTTAGFRPTGFPATRKRSRSTRKV